jgi:hypothetical protein
VIIGETDLADDTTIDGSQAGRLFGLITKCVTSDRETAIRAVAAIMERPINRVRTAVKKALILAKRAQEDDEA